MDDVRVVNRGDRGRHVVGHGGDATQRDRAGEENLRERGSFDVLGDDEGLRRLRFGVDDVGNEGRAHRVHGARLAREPNARGLRRGQRRVHRFEGDTHSAAVLSQPHGARAARPEPTKQPVAAQFLAFFHPLSLPGPRAGRVHPSSSAASPGRFRAREHDGEAASIHHPIRAVQGRARVVTSA